jgi:hypothetical protein
MVAVGTQVRFISCRKFFRNLFSNLRRVFVDKSLVSDVLVTGVQRSLRFSYDVDILIWPVTTVSGSVLITLVNSLDFYLTS